MTALASDRLTPEIFAVSLTPIVCDVPLDLPPEGLGLEPDFPALEQLFAFLEMRTPKDRLFMILNRRTGASPGAVAIADDEPELKVEVLSEVPDAVDFLGRVEALVDQAVVLRALEERCRVEAIVSKASGKLIKFVVLG